MFDPTEEQEAILQAVKSRRESLMINAYAGCGKTSTLELVARLVEGEALAIAFNKKIVLELERRLPSNFTIKSFNGLGHQAWGRLLGQKLTLDDRKVGKIVQTLEREGSNRITPDQFAAVRSLVSAAQKVGLVHSKFGMQGLVEDSLANWKQLAANEWLEVDDLEIGLAREALRVNCEQAFQGLVSFDDQVYMSALFGGRYTRYQTVLVDEAQDLSPLNHMQVAKSCSDRLIVCGDAKQAIYAFRGADSSSMQKLRGLKSSWVDRPLAMTFRCPRVVVQRNVAHAPNFRAHAANAEGLYVALGANWKWPDVTKLAEDNGCKDVAVLCRNNAPLVAIAFKLIAKGIGVTMLGRELGKGLTSLVKKLSPKPDTPIADVIKRVMDWETTERSKALANEDEAKAEGVSDRAGCILAVADAGVSTQAELCAKLEALFARQDGLVTLSTGHRAKGLEWDLVLHLDAWRVPSKYAKGPQLEQEFNLKYVIETRARRVLVEANLDAFAVDA